MCNTHFFVAHTLKYVYSIPCVHCQKWALTYSPKNCERIFHWYTVTWEQLSSHKKCERTRRRHISLACSNNQPCCTMLPLTVKWMEKRVGEERRGLLEMNTRPCMHMKTFYIPIRKKRMRCRRTTTECVLKCKQQDCNSHPNTVSEGVLMCMKI